MNDFNYLDRVTWYDGKRQMVGLVFGTLVDGRVHVKDMLSYSHFVPASVLIALPYSERELAEQAALYRELTVAKA